MAAKNGRIPKKSVFEQLKQSAVEEELQLPGVNTKIVARSLNSAALKRVLLACLKEGRSPEDANAYDDERLQAMMVAATVVDAKGKPVFSEEEATRLEDLDPTIVTEIIQAVNRVNRFQGESAGNV